MELGAARVASGMKMNGVEKENKSSTKKAFVVWESTLLLAVENDVILSDTLGCHKVNNDTQLKHL